MTIEERPKKIDRIWHRLDADVILTEYKLGQISDSEKEKVRYAIKRLLWKYGKIRCVLYLLEGFEMWDIDFATERIQSVVALLNAIHNQELHPDNPYLALPSNLMDELKE